MSFAQGRPSNQHVHTIQPLPWRDTGRCRLGLRARESELWSDRPGGSRRSPRAAVGSAHVVVTVARRRVSRCGQQRRPAAPDHPSAASSAASNHPVRWTAVAALSAAGSPASNDRRGAHARSHRPPSLLFAAVVTQKPARRWSRLLGRNVDQLGRVCRLAAQTPSPAAVVVDAAAARRPSACGR